jgi:hypothetical protein
MSLPTSKPQPQPEPKSESEPEHECEFTGGECLECHKR